MLTKLIVAAIIVIGALVAIKAFSGAANARVDRRPGGGKRRMEAEDLVECPGCGAYLMRNERCETCDRPIP